MEEFDEEDILWPPVDKKEDNKEHKTQPVIHSGQHRRSAPISIPSRGNFSQSWTAGINYINQTGNNSQDDYGDDGDGDDYNGSHRTPDNGITPPHIFLQRKNDGKMARSVCEGYGRTLKGRDLRDTRDKILRLTGFLEQ